MTNLDCVLIGFNEIDFADFATAQEVFQESSGADREPVTNLVLVGDRRLTYMDLLNRAMERTTGRPSALTAFEMPSLGSTDSGSTDSGRTGSGRMGSAGANGDRSARRRAAASPSRPAASLTWSAS